MRAPLKARRSVKPQWIYVSKVAEIGRVERDLLAERDAVQSQAFATAYTMTILGGIASLIIATLMGVLLARGISTPIARMTRIMTTLAKGDTTVDVPRGDRGDEIGAMAVAVQTFKESMIERERAQADLAHINRVTTMGQLTASIAHEVNQPVAAVVTNADAGLRFLALRNHRNCKRFGRCSRPSGRTANQPAKR